MFQTHLKQQTHLMQNIKSANMFQTHLKPKTHLNRQNQTLHELRYSIKLSTKNSPTLTINYANQFQSTCTKTEMRISQHNNIANLDIWKYNGHPRNLNHSMRKQYKKSKYGIELNTSNPCKQSLQQSANTNTKLLIKHVSNTSQTKRAECKRADFDDLSN